MMLSNLGVVRINADDTAGAAQVIHASLVFSTYILLLITWDTVDIQMIGTFWTDGGINWLERYCSHCKF